MLAIALAAGGLILFAGPAEGSEENGFVLCGELGEYEETTECVPDDCNDNPTSCTFDDPFGDVDWTAMVTCPVCVSGDIVVLLPGTNPDGSPGFADIDVVKGDVKVTLETTGRGTPPGRAAVFIDNSATPLQKCTGQVTEDCVKIKRVRGGHTQYAITFGEDARFRFR